MTRISEASYSLWFRIWQNQQNGSIELIVKGADTVLRDIVQYNDWLDEECSNMAREGLRTLAVAKKTLTELQYNEFQVWLWCSISIGNCFLLPIDDFRSSTVKRSLTPPTGLLAWLQFSNDSKRISLYCVLLEWRTVFRFITGWAPLNGHNL